MCEASGAAQSDTQSDTNCHDHVMPCPPGTLWMRLGCTCCILFRGLIPRLAVLAVHLTHNVCSYFQNLPAILVLQPGTLLECKVVTHAMKRLLLPEMLVSCSFNTRY